MFEGKVVLQVLEECDDAKMFPSDNQHLQQKRSTVKISYNTLTHGFPCPGIKPMEVQSIHIKNFS